MKEEKGISLIILGLIIGLIVVAGALTVFWVMNNNDNSSTTNISNNSSDNNKINVDLSVDESISKAITGNLVGDCLYAKGTTYSYEYLLPNWNRYTFLKEYEPEYPNEPGKIYVIDYDKKNNENKKTASSGATTNDFSLDIDYSVDKYSSATWDNIRNRATGHLGYTKAGSPAVYGNENGYWYAYMDKGYNLKTNEDDLDKLNICIWKEMAKFENAHKTPMGNNVVGDEYHALEIIITASYENETGKIRLNYLLNDLKEMLSEKYELDLSELSIEMIK